MIGRKIRKKLKGELWEMKKAVLFLSWLVLALPCAGEIIIVDDGGYGDFDNIQAAIDDSNDGDIIYVLPGTYTGPGNRDIDFAGRAITVTGVEPEDPYIVAATVIDCNSAGGGFYFHSAEEPNSVLAGLTITNGYAEHGGAVRCDNSSPTIANCIITANTSYEGGGGICCKGSQATIDNCLISYNQCPYSDGGGIRCYEGSPTIENCVISNNTARSAGGIFSSQSSPTITNCIITANTGYDGGGGGICCYEGSPTIEDCLINNNTGGAIRCSQSSPTIVNCIITGNTGSNGGGIYCYDSHPYIGNCTISHNGANHDGGGIYCQASNCRIISCTITGNRAEGDWTTFGGGMYFEKSCLTISNCTITRNSSDAGGGFYCRESTPRVTRCTISGNDGGGIACNEGTDLQISKCTISENSARYEGGGICCWKGSGLITQCKINGNRAGHCGGGIHCEEQAGVTIIADCTLSGNFAEKWYGGGVNCEDSDVVITNCSIAENSSRVGGGVHSNVRSSLRVANCILWGNAPCEVDGGLPMVTYCDIRGGWEGEGNLDADPCFVLPGYWADINDPNIVLEPNDPNAVWIDGDYHLLASSPCINAGDPNFAAGPNESDIDGQPRVMGGIVDMGADEFFQRMLLVVKPEGGEVWVAASLHEILWIGDLCEGTVDIILSPDDGNNWQSVETNVPDTGSYAWHLPGEVDSNQCVIAIVPSIPDPNVICIESGLFTIHPDSPGPPVASKWKSLGGDFDRRGLSENYGPELGCVKWTFETGGPIPASITIGAYDRVQVPCEDGRVYTLDANGALLWSYDTNSPVLSAASVGPDGTIYVGTESGRLYAVDVNGEVRWTHDAEGFIYSSPAVSPDGSSTYVCSSDGVVCALGADGSVLWTFQTKDTTGIGSSIFASPAVGPDGTIYVAAVRDPNLYALDPNDGSVKWACNFEYLISPVFFPDAGTDFGWPLASPVVGPDGTIYQTLLYDPNLYAIDPNTGAILWSVQTPRYRPYRDSDGWSEPAVGADGTIYFGSSDANLWAVEPNGSTSWITRLGMTTGLTLTVGSNGLIYAADNDGWLCVVDPNGNELSRFYSGGWLNSPVMAADDTVIIGDVNNKVWAITGADCGEGPFELHRPEDLNGSLLVNFEDFALLAADWPNSKNPHFPLPVYWPPYDWDGTYFVGDIDRNLDVDFADVAAMANRWLSGD